MHQVCNEAASEIGSQTKKIKSHHVTTQYFIEKKDLLQLCGADQSSPLLWPKLHTLNLSNNHLLYLDTSFVSFQQWTLISFLNLIIAVFILMSKATHTFNRKIGS